MTTANEFESAMAAHEDDDLNEEQELPPTEVGIMWDIESLALSPKCVISQLAFVAFDLLNPFSIIKMDEQFLPLNPQLSLNRVMSGDTIVWWLQQDDAARAMFTKNTGDDFQELVAQVESSFAKVKFATEHATKVEHYARGPQFDMVAIESLAADLGLTVPWRYYQVRDLRTIMAEAVMAKDAVKPKPSYVPHHALSDCRYQLDCLIEARRLMRATR